jgi:ribonuclease E
MKKEMLINVLQPEECRIAILEDGVLEELYVERTGHESYVGNIYKGRIVNIEPSIQAAFVDFGVGRNGFLHVSDVEPTYYRHLEQRRGERGDRGDFGERDRDRDRRGGRDRERPRRPVRIEMDEVMDLEERVIPPPRPVEAPAEAQPQEAADFAAGVPLEPLPPPAEAAAAEPEVPPPLPPPVERAVEAVEKAEAAVVGPEPLAPPPPPAAPVVPPVLAVEAPPAQPEPPLVALPETRIEEDTGKPKRRSRSGGMTRRKKSAAAEEPPAEEPREAPGAAEGEGKEAPPEPPRPRLMDSAEHRTTDKGSGEEGSPGRTPGAGGAEDEDLFFPPREEPGEGPAAEVEPPEPRAEPVAPRSQPPRESAPPRRQRPSGSRGSIEADLEADLEAAEIGDEEPPEPPFEEDFDYKEPEEDLEELPRGPSRRLADEGPRAPRGRRDEEGGRRDRDERRGRRNGRRALGGRPGSGRPKPLIQDIFKRGQEVIVQVIKEGIGTKGPTLSTYISIAGRYLVLMPCLNRTGVSRKINDDEQRRRLREMFNELKPPRGLGFIMRTAAIDKNKKELQRDLVYLSRLWQVVARRIRKLRSPDLIYQESDMITRTIRDTFTSDIDTIWVDEPAAYEKAKEFLEVVMPRFTDRIRLYEGKEPLFHKYGIEDEIARIQQKKVPLPMGGSIVIEQTEALVAIDVNSGNFRADNNAEETAYQMNLQAAKEIARQLRLRDLGGVIVNDFIDMREEKHRRGVEKALRDAMKRDRARTKILKISQFGLIEMTRQRIRPSLKRSVYQDCPYCHGMAQVKTCESMSIEVMRLLQLAAHREQVSRVEITVAHDVADYLQNKKRCDIAHLEEGGGISVQVRGVYGAPPERLEFLCFDNNGNEVKLLPPEPLGRARH